MKKILVTGANGQLGSELRDLSALYRQYEFIFLTRGQLDISSKEDVEAAMSKHQPNYFINASAYTAVDLAEDEETKAFAVNADGVENIAAACAKQGCKLIHISTDYVFDGTSKRPYVEEDVVAPVSAYGRSKLAGEEACISVNPDAIIIRTSWVYSVHGKNFVKTMKRLLTEKQEIGVVADQYGSPTSAADLAEVIMQIIGSENWKPGIYHFSNDGAISWFDFASEIKNLLRSNCHINALTTDQYPTQAVRPKFSVMNTDKIVASFNVRKKDWKSSLKACVQRLSS